LSLIRLGIGNARVANVPKQIDWNKLEDIAAMQGLSAVMVDGLEKLPDDNRPPKLVLLQWIGEILQGYEYRYDQYSKVIAEMAAFYNAHGFKMMVLKGYACSLDWPKPEHRPCGDIDIWLFGRQQAADSALAASPKFQVSGSKIDKSHHHHSVFNWGEFTVENHYDFVNVHQNKTNAKIEKILKELGNLKVESSEYRVDSQLKECSDTGCKFPTVVLNGEIVYLPSPNLFALFLIKHTMLHFVMGEFSFRQLLDWAFFVKKHGKAVDWPWLLDVLEQYGMMPAFDIFNAICVEDLGFEISIFPRIQFNPAIKAKVISEILHPEYNSNDPEGLIAGLVYKFRRWKGSSWKYELCYNESRWSSFWSGVWGHLLKPKSFEH